MEILPKNSTELVEVIENEICVSHRTIAQFTNNQEKNIAEMIAKYKSHIEEFGVIPFKTDKPTKGSNGGRPIITHYLNEQQATFLMTLLRNNPTVVNFKKNLVKAFFLMKQANYDFNEALKKEIEFFELNPDEVAFSENKYENALRYLSALQDNGTYIQKFVINLIEENFQDKQKAEKEVLETKRKMEQMKEDFNKALSHIPLALLEQSKQTSTHKMILRFNEWMKENKDNFEWRECKVFKQQNRIPPFLNFGCINGKDETISISVKELNIFCDENNFSNRTFLKIFEDRKLLIIDNDIDNDIHYKGYVYKIKGFPESILHLSFKGCGGNIALCS